MLIVAHVDPRWQPLFESVFVLSIDGEVISGIRVVRNPDKLAYIDGQLARLQ